MAVAAMQTPFQLSGKFLPPEVRERIGDGDDGRRPGQVDVWRGIDKPVAAAPYVHPLVRRSSSSMSLESLQMCTESLGSESSSDYFSDHDYGRVEVEGEEERREIEFAEENVEETEESRSTCRRGTELGAAMNYQCSSVSRRPTPRWFPPPLTSRRDGPCLHMVSHRRDGRLVVEAVPMPSRNYLHASREGGRLLLSIVGATANSGDQNEEKEAVEVANSDKEAEVEEAEEATLVEEEEEEEVEVAYRVTVVDVKVSTQPQQQSFGTAPKKILRLSLVINKFLGATPENKTCTYPIQPESRPLRPTSAVAASSEPESTVRPAPGPPPPESTLLFTSKRRNREPMLRSTRRCSQLRRPLIFWEPFFIATSS